MNRCEIQTLFAFGITMTILAAFGIVGAIIAAPTIWAMLVILIATGLISSVVAYAFLVSYRRCRAGR